VNERQVKTAAVISVDGIHTINGFKKVIHRYLFPDQLHQLALPAINQINADNGYIRILAGQAGGLNIEIGVKWQLQFIPTAQRF